MNTQHTITPDLVDGLQLGPSSIAEIAGVSRSLVSRWRSGAAGPGFPEQVGGTAQRPLFPILPVMTWLVEQGKWDSKRFTRLMPTIALKQLAESLEAASEVKWQTGCWLLETACLAKMAVLSDADIAAETTIEQVRAAGAAAAELRAPWRVVVPGSAQAGRPNLHGRSTDVDVLLGTVETMLQIAGRVQFLAKIEEYGDQVVRDFLRGRDDPTTKALSVSRATTTQLLVGKAAAQVADLLGATVVDPCAGIGDLLLGIADEIGQSGRHGPVRLVGLEPDAHRARVARQRAFLKNVDLDVREHDALRDAPEPDLAADLVVTAPFYGPAGSDSPASYAAAIRANDPRWTDGIPASEAAWLMVSRALLKGGGWALVAASAGMLRDPADNVVVRELISSGWIASVTVGSGHDLWGISFRAAREHVLVSDTNAEGWTPYEVTRADGLVRTDWLIQNWSTQVRSKLVERSKVSPMQNDVPLGDAVARVVDRSAALRMALDGVGLPAQVAEVLRGTDAANRATVEGLLKSGHLEIVGVGAKEQVDVDLLATDVLVALSGGIRTESGPATVRLGGKSFILRVLKSDELDPRYLKFALAGLANELVRNNKEIPRLADRLKLFEIPMLTRVDQLLVSREILKIDAIRTALEATDLVLGELRRLLVDAIRFGADLPGTDASEAGAP